MNIEGLRFIGSPNIVAMNVKPWYERYKVCMPYWDLNSNPCLHNWYVTILTKSLTQFQGVQPQLGIPYLKSTTTNWIEPTLNRRQLVWTLYSVIKDFFMNLRLFKDMDFKYRTRKTQNKKLTWSNLDETKWLAWATLISLAQIHVITIINWARHQTISIKYG